MQRILEKLKSPNLYSSFSGSLLSLSCRGRPHRYQNNAASSACTKWLKREIILFGIVEKVEFSIDTASKESEVPSESHFKNTWKLLKNLEKSWNHWKLSKVEFCFTDILDPGLPPQVNWNFGFLVPPAGIRVNWSPALLKLWILV